MSTTKYEDLIIYTDGGSRGNPGPSASGYVIYDEYKNLLLEDGLYLGITTNNQAEYRAVELSLEKAINMGAKRLKVFMDSQLVARQMSGQYRVKSVELMPIYLRIRSLIRQLEDVKFEHVRREFNKESDAVVNRILDANKH